MANGGVKNGIRSKLFLSSTDYKRPTPFIERTSAQRQKVSFCTYQTLLGVSGRGMAANLWSGVAPLSSPFRYPSSPMSITSGLGDSLSVPLPGVVPGPEGWTLAFTSEL